MDEDIKMFAEWLYYKGLLVKVIHDLKYDSDQTICKSRFTVDQFLYPLNWQQNNLNWARLTGEWRDYYKEHI